MSHRPVWIVAAALVTLGLAPLGAGHAHAADAIKIQSAAAQDIRIFEPYIGRFQSKTYTADNSDKKYHYVVEYRWFDPKQQIVKFSISTVVPEDGRVIAGGDGFYGYDPFESRLYACGFFPNGTSGFGAVSEFDHETKRRVTFAKSQGPDGVTVSIRDEFEWIDADHWGNKTYMKRGDAEWQLVQEDEYTRVSVEG